jgi:hypothetical protein
MHPRPGPETTPGWLLPVHSSSLSSQTTEAKSPPKINKAGPFIASSIYGALLHGNISDNGGYVLSSNKQMQSPLSLSPILKSHRWRFFWVLHGTTGTVPESSQSLREGLVTPSRSLGDLSPQQVDWYEFAVLLLMICSSMIWSSLFLLWHSENTVTPNLCCKNIKRIPCFGKRDCSRLDATWAIQSIIAAGQPLPLVVPRNYRAVQNYKGWDRNGACVGPYSLQRCGKWFIMILIWVFISHLIWVYFSQQGVPIDIHLLKSSLPAPPLDCEDGQDVLFCGPGRPAWGWFPKQVGEAQPGLLFGLGQLSGRVRGERPSICDGQVPRGSSSTRVRGPRACRSIARYCKLIHENSSRGDSTSFIQYQ